MVSRSVHMAYATTKRIIGSMGQDSPNHALVSPVVMYKKHPRALHEGFYDTVSPFCLFFLMINV